VGSHQKSAIRITNPSAGGNCFTSRKNADKYVSRLRARWRSNSEIEFLEHAVSQPRTIPPKVLTGWNYDQIDRILTLDEIREIPVILLS